MLAFGAMTLGLVAACSLVVTTKDQCSVDGDCKKFGSYSKCQEGVCVKPGDTGADGGPDGSTDSGSDAADVDAGCFTGTPMVDEEFLNACVDGGCEPFDNCKRLNLCGDASLPALITPPDGGK
jgi:hypothetical protein